MPRGKPQHQPWRESLLRSILRRRPVRTRMKPVLLWSGKTIRATATCWPMPRENISRSNGRRSPSPPTRRNRADRIVAERNNGGDMVEATIRMVDANVPVTTVWASRGKVTRAEPVSAPYEQGRIYHIGTFVQLEDQMTNFTSDFDRQKAGYSPDRLDALVFATTELLVEQMKCRGHFELMRRRAAGETLEQIAGIAASTPERERKTSLQEIYERGL